MTPEAQEEIHCIWDDLSNFEASQSEQAAAQLMARLYELGDTWKPPGPVRSASMGIVKTTRCKGGASPR